MRARLPLFVVLAFLLSPVSTFAAAAHASPMTLAQEQEVDQGDQTNTQTGSDTQDGEDSQGSDTDEGSGSAEAESGANEGQVESGETETGPPWTYQMARITLALLVVMALAMGALYWRLVVQRQRRGV
jgi:hypothetical protein